MIFRFIEAFINCMKPIKKEDRIKLSKETRKKMRERDREFRKAEREGRVVYDDIHHRIYIKAKEEE